MNYLVEGGSGTGKTSVAIELELRGYHVVHGDRKLAYYGDVETGEPLDWPSPENGIDRLEWGYEHWIWPVEAVKALVADTTHPVTFFCGGSRNFHKFLDLFDKVFVLDLDIETLQRRLEGRPNEWGSEPAERALILRYHVSREYLPVGITINTAGTVASVVDGILARLS
jgi:broad-specificity NMP kinase